MSHRPPRTPTPRRRPSLAVVEAVERRALFSAALTNGVLTVAGTDAADTIAVEFTEDGPSSATNGDVFTVTENGVTQTFNTADVTGLVVNAGAGDDTVVIDQGDSGDLTVPISIAGGDGNDAVTVTLDEDTLYPVGSTGGLSVDGGAGDDALTVNVVPGGTDAGLAVSVTGDDGDDTIAVTANENATLSGGAGNDSLSAVGNATMEMDGGDGNDSLLANGYTDGTFHADMYGGAGDDVFSLTSNTDLITCHGGDGTDTVLIDEGDPDTAVIDLSGGPSTGDVSTPDGDVENVTDTDDAHGGVEVIGSAADNDITLSHLEGATLIGGGGNDRLDATDSQDRVSLDGGDGNDTLVGDAGGTVAFSGGAGTDVADFSAATDPLSLFLDGSRHSGLSSQVADGTAGDTFDGTVEQAYGGSGNDLVVGTAGDNALFGNAGSDTLVANGGTDALFGGTGNDTLVARDGGATYVDGGNDGSDVADADAAVDTVTGVAVVDPGIAAGSAQLTGTPTGTAGSYHGDGETIANAFDGDLDTAVDAAAADGGTVGLDFGTAQVITQLSFAPAPSLPDRMVGGVFQASDLPDFSADVATLYTVTATPTADVLTTVPTNVTTPYRYLRYVGPAGAYDNIAELQAFGTAAAAVGPTTGTVSGTVYDDANGDGSQDDGEAGLAGQGVYLDVNADAVEDAGDLTATTTADGAFTIAAVPAGTYALRQVLPAGYTQTAPAAGSYTATVTAGSTSTGLAFGDTPAATPAPTPTATTGTVDGIVFVDANGNGALDTGEVGLAGRAVYLDVNGDGTADAGDLTATTDAGGAYTIGAVPAGTYTVRDVVPAGYTQTLPTTGSASVAVTAGGTVAGPNFGDAPTPTATPTPIPTPIPTPTPAPTLPASTLAVAVLTTPAASVVGGTAGVVKVRVTNSAGAAFAGPVTVQVYASADGTLSGEAVLAGVVTSRPLRLKPSRSAVVAVRFTYPASLASGSYQLIAAATPTSTQASAAGTALTQPATGVASRAVAVAAPFVDLSASLPASVRVRAGLPGAVAVRLTNAGNTVAVGSASVTLYASASGTVDAAAVMVGTANRAVKVRSGRAVAVRVRFTAPASLVAGAYRLVAVVTPTTTPADDDAADDTAAALTR